jgi:hypothetical protein
MCPFMHSEHDDLYAHETVGEGKSQSRGGCIPGPILLDTAHMCKAQCAHFLTSHPLQTVLGAESPRFKSGPPDSIKQSVGHILPDIKQVYIEEKQFILLCIPRRLRVTQGRCSNGRGHCGTFGPLRDHCGRHQRRGYHRADRRAHCAR